MVGSDVYVCYKKSQSANRKIAYKPEVLDCFPSLPSSSSSISTGNGNAAAAAADENVSVDGGIENLKHRSLATNVPMFCLPMGALIECWPSTRREAEKQFRCNDHLIPKSVLYTSFFSTFVLTDETGTKFYGASLTFYEAYERPLTEAQLKALEASTSVTHAKVAAAPQGGAAVTEEQQQEEKVGLKRRALHFVSLQITYHCNKSICVVSRHPFFESFRRFLYFLYNLSISGPHRIPIERYISHLVRRARFTNSIK